MIISVLLILIGVAVFIQPNAPRFFAASIFIGLTSSHELFLSHLNGLAYYGSAALLDLGIIVLTSGISPIPKMVITLHKICVLSIFVNFAGWIAWRMYLSPVPYEFAFVVIYAWTIVALMKRSGVGDVRGFGLDSWGSCFHYNLRPCFSQYSRNGNAV